MRCIKNNNNLVKISRGDPNKDSRFVVVNYEIVNNKLVAA